jgi:excisionase family DNA binding protein
MAIERRWFKISEIAEYLNLHPQSVYELWGKGIIPGTKIKGIGVRLDKKKLDELLEENSLDALRKRSHYR